MATGESAAYVVAHLEQRLAEDDRTSELGIHVRVVGEQIVLSGAVTTPQRRDAIEVIAREVLGDQPFSNDVSVVEVPEAEEMERLS